MSRLSTWPVMLALFAGVATPALALDYQYQVIYAMAPGERPSASGMLVATPSPVQFDVRVGASDVRSVSVTNAGTVPVVISGVGLVAGGAAEFSQSNNCGASLAVGGSCRVDVQFSPTQAATSSAVLAVTFANQALQVPIEGIGRQGILQVSSAAMTFPATAMGSSASQQLTLSNTGNASVELSTYSTAGVDFPVNTDGCSNTLAAGQSCALTVQFKPSATGARSGSLMVVTPEGNRTTTFAGTGTQGIASFSSSSLTFGTVQQGSTSTARAVTLSNTGTATLSVASIALTTGADQFSQTNNCANVAPGASCTVNVLFAPTVGSGAVTGALTVTHNGTGPTNVALSGTAQSPSASLSVPNFAGTPVGSSTTAQAVLTNTGVGAISVTAPSAASVTGTGFTFVSSNCSGTLAPSASCNTTVQFTASNAGNFNGELRVNTLAGEKLAVLAGQATQGAATLSVSSASFPATQVAAMSTQTVTLTNSGSAPLVVSQVSVSAGATDFAQTNTCTTVQVAGTCTVMAKFTPTVAGARTGTITVTHNGSGATSLPLYGQGQAADATLTMPSFGATHVGTSSSSTATLTNTGIDAITLTVPSAASVTGVGYSFVSTTCTTSLAAGAACSVTVRFSPGNTVNSNGLLTISTQAGNRSASMASTGIEGLASVNPGSLAFGVQQVAASSSQSITVTNTGTASLQFSGIGMVSGSTNFAQSNNCGLVAVGASCSITVAFVPTTVGIVTGTVGLTHDGGGVATIALSGEGRAASATLTTPAFGTTSVGASTTADAVLTNTGVGPLSVTAPAVGSVTGTNFSFASSNCPASLPVGQNCHIVVNFAPTATTARSGTLTVSTGAGAQQVPLSATGVQGFASGNTSALAYSTTQVGTTATTQSVVLTNTGSTTLTFAAIGVSAGASDFNQSNNCATLAVNASCSIAVAFTPSAAGVRNGTLSLVHNGGGLDTVTLTGSGQVASATLAAPTFSATPVGSSSIGYAVLANTGIGNLSVTLPGVISAGSSSDFAYSVPGTTCTAMLPAGQNCVFAVRFAPTASVARTGTLVVDTGAGTQSVAIGSTGIIGFASVSPGSLSFSAQQLATSSAGKVVTVTNTGTNTLTFTGVGISAGASDFGQSNNCASVPVNGTCTVNVSFTPTVAGARTGTLSLTHNGGGIANVSLSGTGQVASAALSAPVFSATAINGTSTATATLTNTGVGAISVTVPTAASVTGPGTDFAFVSTTCTSSLSASGTCTATVLFTPAAMGTRTGNLAIATSAGNQSIGFSASATAVDYSANLTSYINPQVAIAGNPAWFTTVGQWYSVNTAGADYVPGGDYFIGRSLTLGGSVPVAAKLRMLADNSINTVKVNGVQVLAASTANFQNVAEDATFTLYPGVNSITMTINNAGADLNPSGWALQVWNAAGTTMIADGSGWAYSGPRVLVYLGAFDGIGTQYHDRTVAASCKQYRFPNPGYAAATVSGYYYVDMGAGTEKVYCDMTTDGGGWTLVARSSPNSPNTTTFGWYGAAGSLTDMTTAYSMNVMSRNLAFTETLFGDAPGGVNSWGAYVYKHAYSRGSVASLGTSPVSITMPTKVSAAASTGFGMASSIGYTTSSSHSYFFRDMPQNPDSYGLWAWGWNTAYGTGPSDVAGQAVGASYGGYINGSSGMLMVR